MSKAGQMLAGSAQRFATLDSVGAAGRASLSDAQCDEAIEWMRDYYDEGKPVYGSWFNALSRSSRASARAFAPVPPRILTWCRNRQVPCGANCRSGRRRLCSTGTCLFLEWEIRAFALRAVICTGKTVSVNVCRAFDVQVAEEGALARIKWSAGHATSTAARSASSAGTTHSHARPDSAPAVRSELGRLLAEKLGLTAPLKTEPTRSDISPSASLPRGAPRADSVTAGSPTLSPVSATRDSRLKGVTHAAWDGVSLPTLRDWLRWWQDETKSAGRIENGWGREEQIARISAEIAAREAANVAGTCEFADRTLRPE